jgi:tRNA A37 threonylcarbamoyladenosine biosynthesis protein TsaE
VLVVEWPERAEGVLPEDHLLVRFEVTGENGRALEFESCGTGAGRVLAQMWRN